ncbi:DUF4097 family beta strand repeat-containing protein [Actinomadura atramentaria]|uniref:DUF4097 family beta strand repeat-containing protein n=1 Tax=Actinomadura atramentaria TaxID=1990 RepID=UPI0003717D2E|nr:DUF4097 family beta strand repeat-containing protein [Actinomadura atramentaria]
MNVEKSAARTLRFAPSGPVPLRVNVPVGTVEVFAEAGISQGSVTLEALGDDPAVGRTIDRALLSWDERQETLAVDVPDLDDNAAAVGGVTVIGGVTIGSVSNGATLTQIVGSVMDGVVIDGSSVTVMGGTSARRGVRVVVRLPEGSTVAARTRTASVSAVGEYAGVRVRTSSGSVTIGDADQVNVETVSGDLWVGAVGVLEAVTVSGDVRAWHATYANVRTTSGDVLLSEIEDRVRVHSVSGDVDVSDCRGRAEITTVSGDARLRARRPEDATVQSVSGVARVSAAPQ